jgi:hypothetical protein
MKHKRYWIWEVKKSHPNWVLYEFWQPGTLPKPCLALKLGNPLQLVIFWDSPWTATFATHSTSHLFRLWAGRYSGAATPAQYWGFDNLNVPRQVLIKVTLQNFSAMYGQRRIVPWSRLFESSAAAATSRWTFSLLKKRNKSKGSSYRFS